MKNSKAFFQICVLSTLSLFSTSISYSQDKAAGFLASAKTDLEDGDRFSALVTLDSAVTLSPRFAEAYFLRAKVRMEIQNLKGAVDDLSNVIRLNPGNSEAYYERANLYLELNYHRDYSIRDLSEAIALDYKNTSYLVKRAYVRANTINSYNGKQEYDLAIDDLTRAIRITPDDANLFYLRAGYYFQLNNRNQAMSNYSKAIEINDREPRFLADRGLLYLIMEDYKMSARDYMRAISIDPENSLYYRHLAQAYYNFGDFPSAVNSYSEAINVLIRKLKGMDKEEDTSSILEALRDIYLMRGSAFANLNRSGEACDDFGRSRELGERRAVNYMRKYCSN